MDTLSDPQVWWGLGQVTLINIVLSGVNAIIIALAVRSLPPRQQQRASGMRRGRDDCDPDCPDNTRG